MKKLKLTLTLAVEYDLDGAEPSELRDRLRQVAQDAYANGVITDDLDASIDSFSIKIVGSDDRIESASGKHGPVSYDDPRDPSTIQAWLRNIPGNSEVCIDDDGLRLQVVGNEEIYLEIGGPPDTRESLSVEEFACAITGDEIDPAKAYRMLCQEMDGDQVDEDTRCRLEMSDHPAFRQGLNDHADSMQKDGQWVTFNNGNHYHSAEDVKATIANFDESEHEYSPELKSILYRWL